MKNSADEDVTGVYRLLYWFNYLASVPIERLPAALSNQVYRLSTDIKAKKTQIMRYCNIYRYIEEMYTKEFLNPIYITGTKRIVKNFTASAGVVA